MGDIQPLQGGIGEIVCDQKLAVSSNSAWTAWTSRAFPATRRLTRPKIKNKKGTAL